MARTVGFFTDTTLCIGCKACEVACKEWNQLPGHAPAFGDGYDNTGRLDEQNWRYVQFHERTTAKGGVAWNMMSDVCKHCAMASCMEVCPTNAIIRTEFDTVYIQPSVCNGCRDCIAPVRITSSASTRRAAWPQSARSATTACRPTCCRLRQGVPTESIKFGDLSTMREVAGARLNQLRGQGMSEARLYGDKEYGGLHALFLLTDAPEAYGLPNAENAVLPSRNNVRSYLGSLVTAAIGIVGAVFAFRERGGKE